jgi:hypothetical protein
LSRCALKPVHATRTSTTPTRGQQQQGGAGGGRSKGSGGRGSLELLEDEKQMCNLISKYSPEYVRSRALESPGDALAVLGRVATIVTSLGSYFACLAFDRLAGTEDSPDTVRRRAQQLRETLTHLGPSFIKVWLFGGLFCLVARCGRVCRTCRCRRMAPPVVTPHVSSGVARRHVCGPSPASLLLSATAARLPTPAKHNDRRARCWPTARTLCARTT